MGTVPQVRKLSKVIQDLEPFPILFWSSIAVVVLFALIIVTLIILIACVKRRTGKGRLYYRFCFYFSPRLLYAFLETIKTNYNCNITGSYGGTDGIYLHNARQL